STTRGSNGMVAFEGRGAVGAALGDLLPACRLVDLDLADGVDVDLRVPGCPQVGDGDRRLLLGRVFGVVANQDDLSWPERGCVQVDRGARRLARRGDRDAGLAEGGPLVHDQLEGAVVRVVVRRRAAAGRV